MEWIAFVFGLIIGSFLNVVILRFDDWQSILHTRSKCPNCKEQLRWYDLIPVISYATLRGRCRYCQKPISWQYPVVELVTAFLFLFGYQLIFVYNIFPLWREIFAAVAFVVAVTSLIVIFFHDLYEMMIPESFAYILLASGFLFGYLTSYSLADTLLGGLVGLIPIGLLVFLGKGKWMGEGDIKVAAGLGLLVGYPVALAFIVLAFLLGGLYGVYLIATKQATLKSAVPFAPFLIIAGLLVLFQGQQIIMWYVGGFGGF